MLTLHVTSGRELRESDVVRVPSSGRVGTVVGIDYGSADTLVVQYPGDGTREQVGVNEVELLRTEHYELPQPAPSVQALAESITSGPIRCGAMACYVSRDGSRITFVPKNGIAVDQLAESWSKGTTREAVERLVEVAYVTRLPHLVRVGSPWLEVTVLERLSPEAVARCLDE